jgi:hypothetical protein
MTTDGTYTLDSAAFAELVRERTDAVKKAAALESELFALGIQHEALKARLKLAEACVSTLRDVGEADCPYRDNCPVFGSNHGACDGCRARRALAAFDAVPGDVVPQGCPFDEPTNGVVGKDVAPRRAQLASLTIQRDAAEALARERTNERDYYARELDKATGMVELHVDDAEAARLLWRQSEAACAQMHAERDAAIRERDAALAAYDAVPGDV